MPGWTSTPTAAQHGCGCTGGSPRRASRPCAATGGKRLEPFAISARIVAPSASQHAEVASGRLCYVASMVTRVTGQLVHGHCDRRFDNVAAALADELSTGGELGAAIAIDVD